MRSESLGIASGLTPFARSLSLRLSLLVSLLVSMGCASHRIEQEGAPAHPFPRWVDELEIGATRIEGVRARFGQPDEIEASARGGRVWRYAFAEFRGAEAVSARPPVSSSEGMPSEPVPSPDAQRSSAVGRWLEDVGEAIEDLLFFPPTQPRPARIRHLPARIHALDLEFMPDGTLRRYRYAPRQGRAPVPGDV